jgi:hypothetical protein
MTYKSAKSGEVFYIHNNVLCVADCIEDMQRVFKVDLLDRNTYFEYSIKGVNYKTLITNRKQISKHAKLLSIDDMIALSERYNTEYDTYLEKRGSL